jgi:ribonuclease R
VIRQAEAAGRAENPAGDYARIKANLESEGAGGHVEDLRALPFVTIDPPGAGDLDDAYHIEKHADGSYTWLLATADVAHYVRPGTPAFRAAARIGNTFYSIDKDGVGEYPMNHPVVSKNLASLLDGKDSLAMITRMRFDANGRFLLDKSEVFLGLVHVKGRYTYNQAAALWKGESGHGVSHVEQVNLARELSGKLSGLDGKRGKMSLTLDQTESVKQGGVWSKRLVVEDPLLSESHHLIEELKVYGNRVIATRLTSISRDGGIPHISRVQSRRDLSPEKKQVAQWLVLTSRQSASYAAVDAEGHEGLSLEAGAYDHPSAPIRRFSDMYNRALLEASLEGADPKEVHAAVLRDLKSMGFQSLEDYLRHLNGREQATRQMDYEVDAFMSLVELSKPENAGKTFRGYVRLARGGRNPSATIQLDGSAATIVVSGPDALQYKLLDRVSVTVKGVDLSARRLDARIVKAR